MNNKLISIVLPTRNGSRFIDQSIESIVKQSQKNWELIVVDDASNDDTPAKIDWWATQDIRIRAYHLTNNRKLPGALNYGFSLANGDYHTWTSDDNWYECSALTKMVDVLDRQPDISIVYTDLYGVDEYGAINHISKMGPVTDLYKVNCMGGCFLYRADVTRSLNGYDEGLFGAEDYDFWLRASLKFKFQRIPEALYYVRTHKGSLTSQKQQLIARNVEIAIRRWLREVKWQNDMMQYKAFVEWGVRCLRAGSWEDVFVPWINTVPWLTAESRTKMHREVLKRCINLVQDSFYRRDWPAVSKYREYLFELSDDPDVAKFLATKYCPKWVYNLKDRLRNVRDVLRRWHLWRQPMIHYEPKAH
jgi:glycosyltransferase involved in cell wall biosynthesis